jgi:hypothetical protein
MKWRASYLATEFMKAVKQPVACCCYGRLMWLSAISPGAWVLEAIFSPKLLAGMRLCERTLSLSSSSFCHEWRLNMTTLMIGCSCHRRHLVGLCSKGKRRGKRPGTVRDSHDSSSSLIRFNKDPSCAGDRQGMFIRLVFVNFLVWFSLPHVLSIAHSQECRAQRRRYDAFFRHLRAERSLSRPGTGQQ